MAVRLEPADLAVLGGLVAPGSELTARWRDAWWYLHMALLAVLLLVALLEPVGWVAVALFVAITAVSLLAGRQGPARWSTTWFDGLYTATHGGLRRDSEHSESVVRWAAIDDVVSTPTHHVVRFAGSGWVIPRRCFDTPSSEAAFLGAIAAGRLGAA